MAGGGGSVGEGGEDRHGDAACQHRAPGEAAQVIRAVIRGGAAGAQPSERPRDLHTHTRR